MTKSLPAFTQDQSFTFTYLRQDGSKSPGVFLTGDMAVSPGTGLQVSIAAGEARIQQTVARLGAFYAARGTYYIFDDSVDQPYNTITAPVTYPRVDQVIARVYDSYEQQLPGNSYWRYEWLTGTETSGATLTNLDGAAALPDNSLRLAYCLSTVGMSSWSSSNIANVVTLASGRGVANGVATLDSTGNVPLTQLGNYVPSCTVSRPARTSGVGYQPNLTRPTFITAWSETSVGSYQAEIDIVMAATNNKPGPPSHAAASTSAPGTADQSIACASIIVPPAWYVWISVSGSSEGLEVTEVTL